MIFWLALPTALAQQEVCTAALRADTWREAMDAVDASLQRLSIDHADRVLDDVVDQLHCLASPASPDDLGRLARQVSVVAFYEADYEELVSWTWLARDTVGGAPWPEALPVPDRFHELLQSVPEPPMQALEARRLLPPKRGGFLLDGRPVVRPEARSGVVHLLQVLDKKGAMVEGQLQLGSDFPSRWTEEGSGDIDLATHLPQPPAPLPMPLPDAVVVAPEAPDEPSPDADPEDGAPPAPSPAVEAPAPIVAPDDLRDTLTRMRPERTEQAFDLVFPDCPWKSAPQKARVEGREVVVNRQRHPVGQRDEVEATQRVFRSCGEFRAAHRLGRWDEERRKLFRSGAHHRDAMLRVLLADEPDRRTRARRPTKD